MSTPASPQFSSPAGAGASILDEIQLARLSTRLRELGATSSLLRGYGEDPQAYADALVKQFAELSGRRGKPDLVLGRYLGSQLTVTLDRLADLFGAWNTVAAPNASVALVEAPTSSHTSGAIGGEIFTGAISLVGDIYNSDAQEQWWVNTWQYIIPLPAVPAINPNLSPIAYRFNVAAGVGLYRQDFLSGSVHAYATVATTNDLAGQPIEFSNPVSSTFAISADLPTSAVPPILSGNAMITGSIEPAAGKTPAIGIIVGIVFSVAKGEIQIVPGEFSYLWLTNPDAKTTSDLGKIEYRQDSLFWIEAVAQKLQFMR